MALGDPKPESVMFNQYPMKLESFRTMLDILERTFPDKEITALVTERLRPHNGGGSLMVQISLNPRIDLDDAKAE